DDVPARDAAPRVAGHRCRDDPPVPGHVEQLLLAFRADPHPGLLDAPPRPDGVPARRWLRYELAAADGHGRAGDRAHPAPVPVLPALLRRRAPGLRRPGVTPWRP